MGLRRSSDCYGDILVLLFSENLRVLVCGDRNWDKPERVREVLGQLLYEHHIECVIEGEARGADKAGRRAAERLGIPVLKFPADWTTFGNKAGVIRNAQMLLEGRPNLVIAFHSNLAKSKGTKDMVRRARAAGVPVMVVAR